MFSFRNLLSYEYNHQIYEESIRAIPSNMFSRTLNSGFHYRGIARRAFNKGERSEYPLSEVYPVIIRILIGADAYRAKVLSLRIQGCGHG